MPIATANVTEYLQRAADMLAENKEYLTELDSAIGDADHGINMNRGFQAILKKLPSVQDKDAGTILKTAGMTLVSTVGGAGGPLYGTALMQAGMVVAGKYELTGADILAALEAALKGVMMRGKGKPGEKTMIDAIDPAIKALRESLNNGASTADALERAAAAAEQGMKDTIPMIAMKGRASYLGERSRNHQDPGATSSYLLIDMMAKMAKGEK
jgi:dihydroxyacetone kinase-like protein